ncbi:MAG: cyclic pyranopterin phosphate synthase [Planctomycetota bacterium]|jgi:cyclic pyranopterin phosphate synthase
MVDVGAKGVTGRSALARAVVELPAGVGELLSEGGGPKGPVGEVARVAGILGAKRTADLIPMCHPLSLDHVELDLVWLPDDRLEIFCRASCQGRTGVEMEALTGAGVAALTVVDMVKGVSKGVRISCIELLEKTGGKSGTWRRVGAQIPPQSP